MMSFLAKKRKPDLLVLAYEMGIDVGPNPKVFDLCQTIMNASNYDEECVKGQLAVIVEERERQERGKELERQEREKELERQEREKELERQEREKELERQEREKELERQEREKDLERQERERELERRFELEKIRLASTSETNSFTSRNENPSRNAPNLKNIMQKYDPETSDIALYLTLFERQARKVQIEENDYVSHLIPLIPPEMAEIIVKEPEEKSEDYHHIKEVLLNRYKMNSEAFRIKFMHHQKRNGALWKDLAYELKTYLDGWLECLQVTDFESLKELMVTDQIKKRVNSHVREHFLDDWGNFIKSSTLANKLDEYDTVRSTENSINIRKSEKKFNDRSKQSEDDRKNTGNSGGHFRNGSPKSNDSIKKKDNPIFERSRLPACYICHSTTHLRPSCPQLKRFNTENVESINNVITSKSEKGFEEHMCRFKVNDRNRTILRDTGSSIDLIPENFICRKFMTGEFVDVKQPLDRYVKTLPVVVVKLESEDFGTIFTQAAVIRSSLKQKYYLLGNSTAALIEKRKMSRNPENIQSSVEDINDENKVNKCHYFRNKLNRFTGNKKQEKDDSVSVKQVEYGRKYRGKNNFPSVNYSNPYKRNSFRNNHHD